MNSTEYELESPLWQYVTIHLHKGDYQGIREPGADRRYHIYVPYMFEEDQLPGFLHSCIKQMTFGFVCSNDNKRGDFVFTVLSSYIIIAFCKLWN